MAGCLKIRKLIVDRTFTESTMRCLTNRESSGCTVLDDGRELVLPPGSNATVRSIPPSGKCRILNVYWDPDEEKAVFEFEDVPEP